MPMGCALCGHAPYAHGCPGQGADHDYAQPSRELMTVRLEAWRLGILLPASEAFADAEIIPLVPAQRRSEQPVSAAPTPLSKRTPRFFPRPDIRPVVVASPGRDDGRRPTPRPIETRQDRAARLALARDRARVVACAHEHTPRHHTTVLRQPAHLPGAGERRQSHQILRPGSDVTLGRGHPPTSLPPPLPAPYRQKVAA